MLLAARKSEFQARRREKCVIEQLLLLIAIIVLGLLAVGGTVGTMAMTHSGFMGNGYGNGMMGNQQGYQGIMGNQQYNGNMMGGYPQSPSPAGKSGHQ